MPSLLLHVKTGVHKLWKRKTFTIRQRSKYSFESKCHCCFFPKSRALNETSQVTQCCKWPFGSIHHQLLLNCNYLFSFDDTKPITSIPVPPSQEAKIISQADKPLGQPLVRRNPTSTLFERTEGDTFWIFFLICQSFDMFGWAAHRPCLAREADTSSASVDSCGESVMLMLPEEDTLLRRRGDPSVEMLGDLYTISAPWSVRALACSRKFSLWLSIWWEEG